MRPWLLVAAIGCLAGCGEPPPSWTDDAGAMKYASVCRDCHGAGGEGRGIYPRLAGRPAEEIAGLLRHYKSGRKTDHMSDTMRPFAQALGEQEIDQIAAWLARQ